MNRLRIGYVVQRYGLEVNGGSEVHCRLMAERLARFHDVEVLTTCAIDYVTWRDEYPEGVTSLNGVSVRRFKVDYPRNNNTFNEISSHVFGGPHTEEDEIRWMKLQGPYSSKLLAWLEEHRTSYNVFIFQTYLYCTTFFGLPIVSDRAVLVSTAHDEPPIYLTIFEELFQKARYLLYLTPEEAAFLKRRFFALDLKGEVVGLGIESGKAPEPCSEWERLQGQIGNSPYLLYVGRIDESKGCGILIEYFSRYVTETANSDLKLVMVGKSAMAVQRHAQLLTPGFVSEKAKMQAIRACSLLVIPSPYESLSLVALEAWQLERPVLVNGDCAVLRGQCIRSNGGLWYSSYSEFRDALTFLLNDAAVAETIGLQGAEFVRRNYLWDPVEKRLNSILDRVASGDFSDSGPAFARVEVSGRRRGKLEKAVKSDPLVTREQVTAAYRFILGREPENEEVIRQSALGYKTFDALRRGLLSSTEFATQFIRIHDRFPLDLSAEDRVDVTTDAPTLDLLLDRIARAWVGMGTDDPYWSVLSSPMYSRENFGRNQKSFWESGGHDVKRFLIWLERNRVCASPGWSVLEFGCGTGRITRHLGQKFDTVWACDISEPHLRLARDAVRDVARNVRFIHIESMATLDKLPAVDAIFSIIVLQHNPPPVIAHVLDKLLKTLRAGGIAYFQVPTHGQGYTFNVHEYLKSDLNMNMEVHPLPQRYIFDIISANACDVLEIQPDNMLGSPEWISNTFLCRKRSLPSAQEP